MHSIKLQNILDEHKESLSDNAYLELCNGLKDLHTNEQNTIALEDSKKTDDNIFRNTYSNILVGGKLYSRKKCSRKKCSRKKCRVKLYSGKKCSRKKCSRKKCRAKL